MSNDFKVKVKNTCKNASFKIDKIPLPKEPQGGPPPIVNITCATCSITAMVETGDPIGLYYKIPGCPQHQLSPGTKEFTITICPESCPPNGETQEPVNVTIGDSQ